MLKCNIRTSSLANSRMRQTRSRMWNEFRHLSLTTSHAWWWEALIRTLAPKRWRHIQLATNSIRARHSTERSVPLGPAVSACTRAQDHASDRINCPIVVRAAPATSRSNRPLWLRTTRGPPPTRVCEHLVCKQRPVPRGSQPDTSSSKQSDKHRGGGTSLQRIRQYPSEEHRGGGTSLPRPDTIPQGACYVFETLFGVCNKSSGDL